MICNSYSYAMLCYVGRRMEDCGDGIKCAGDCCGDGIKSVGHCCGDDVKCAGDCCGDNVKCAGDCCRDDVKCVGDCCGDDVKYWIICIKYLASMSLIIVNTLVFT